MKNLLYKEFKLSVHPLTYLFMGVMALVCLSPGMPSFLGPLYFSIVYTFLFIGMNKTTTTNDLYYTCNLPIRREDVVKARIFSTTALQLVDLVILFAMMAIETFLIEAKMSPEDLEKLLAQTYPGIGIRQGIFLGGSFLICYGVFDLIYLPWFYKTGKSIIGNMFAGLFAVAIVGAALVTIPRFAFNDLITIGSPNANYFLQFGFLAFAIAFWFASKVIACKISTKNLKKLDF